MSGVGKGPTITTVPTEKKKTISLAQRFAENFDSDDDEGLEEEKKFTLRQLLITISVAMRRIGVYGSLARNDASTRKGSYCLGFLSVFVVVIITVLMFTVMGYLPILFLKLGEQEQGMIDLVIIPGGQVERAQSLNYSVVRNRFPSGDYSYHTPRITFGGMQTYTPGECGGGTIAENPEPLWSPPVGSNISSSACGLRTSCITRHCDAPRREANLYFIDAEREERMNLGVGPFPALGPNECFIEKGLANLMNLTVNSHLLIAGKAPSSRLLQAYIEADLVDRPDVFQSGSSSDYTTFAQTIISLRVVGIMDDNMMKISDSVRSYIFLNYHHALATVASGMSPALPADKRAAFAAVNPDHCATQVLFNFPTGRRNEIYVNTDYDVTQSKATTFAAVIAAPLGFNQIDVDMPILASLFDTRFFSLFMGLLISLIITTLSFLSIVLQYSLLSVNLSTRTFELGVMRMLGFNKSNLVGLVFTNAYFFAVPAWALGLTVGQLLYLYVRSILPVEVPPRLTPDSIGYATLAGLAIPLVAAIAPMLNVLSQQLPDSLDVDRSRVEAIEVTIERNNGDVSWTVVGLGCALAAFGFLIYYLFPLALVNFNLTLLFYIFFAILLGLLFGLILLAVNFERIAEAAVSHAFFWWWESAAVFQLIGKNLTAHRRRNRKTTLMFSMSIGFIIFITVAFQLQITSNIFGLKQRMGGEVQVDGDFPYEVLRYYEYALMTSEELQGIDFKWTYTTDELQRHGIIANATFETLGRYRSAVMQPLSLPPGFFDVVDTEFLAINKQRESPWEMAEHLYSVEGSGQVINPTTLVKVLALDTLDTKFMFLTDTIDSNRTEVTNRKVATSSAFVDSAAVMRFSKFPQVGNLNAVVSIPSFLTKSRGVLDSVRQINYEKIIIRCKESDAGKFETVLARITTALGVPATVTNYVDEADSITTTVGIVDIFFIFTQVMASVICYFALSSSMGTNIYEQTKEIGVLRCIGLRKFQAYRVYMWESYTLVVAASFMGLIVGTIVAYTMTLQQVLFSQLPLPFVFPYFQLVVIVIFSFIIAFLASFFPMRLLLNLPSITQILRKVG